MWRFEELVTEARRNVGPAHIVLGVLGTLVVAALVGVVLMQGHRALTQEAERRDAGSLVWTATAGDASTPLDGAACARLVTLSGVIAAGGQSSSSLPDLYSFTGGRPLPVVGLTPGAVQVFVPSSPWATTTVGSELSALGEVGVGTWLLDARGQRVVRISTLVEPAPIGALMSLVAVPVPPDSPLETCWVRFHPSAVHLGGDVLASAFPRGEATITPFLREQPGTVSPLVQWQRLVAVQPWLLAGSVMLIAVVLVLWSRRVELTVYRTFGSQRFAVGALVGLETAIVFVPGYFGGILLGALGYALVARTGVSPDVAAAALCQAAAALIASLTVSLILLPLSARAKISDALRDR